MNLGGDWDSWLSATHVAEVASGAEVEHSAAAEMPQLEPFVSWWHLASPSVLAFAWTGMQMGWDWDRGIGSDKNAKIIIIIRLTLAGAKTLRSNLIMQIVLPGITWPAAGKAGKQEPLLISVNLFSINFN